MPGVKWIPEDVHILMKNERKDQEENRIIMPVGLPVKGHPSALIIRLQKTERKANVTGRLPLRRANR